tara:strand:- start:106 stop:228 length:123 start_codon:yes stop_codon:yes gene_type:complete
MNIATKQAVGLMQANINTKYTQTKHGTKLSAIPKENYHLN